MNAEQIGDEFPSFRIPTDLDGQGWWRSRPYEDDRLVHERAIRMGRYLVDRFGTLEQERVALVSHADFKMIFAALHGAVAIREFPANIHNGAVSEFAIDEGIISCRSFNQIGHIDKDLHTL